MAILFTMAWLIGILLILYAADYFHSINQLNLEVLLLLLVMWNVLSRQTQRAFGVLDLYITQRMDRLERKVDMTLRPEYRDPYIDEENTATTSEIEERMQRYGREEEGE